MEIYEVYKNRKKSGHSRLETADNGNTVVIVKDFHGNTELETETSFPTNSKHLSDLIADHDKQIQVAHDRAKEIESASAGLKAMLADVKKAEKARAKEEKEK